MRTTRINNISFFVTVLSACLGLLAGGLPVEVYAQLPSASAESTLPLTERRDCGNEDSPEILSLLKDDVFSTSFQIFIANLKLLVSIDKYRPSDYGYIEVSYAETVDGIGRLNTNANDEVLGVMAVAAARQLLEGFAESDLLYRYDGDLGRDATHSKFVFQLDDSGVVITSSQEQKSLDPVQKLVSQYNSYFQLRYCQARNDVDKIYYSNTKALAEDNKLLLVTRLPRAGLEILLAEPPAAN